MADQLWFMTCIREEEEEAVNSDILTSAEETLVAHITVSDAIAWSSVRKLVHVKAGSGECNCKLGNYNVTASDTVGQTDRLL